MLHRYNVAQVEISSKMRILLNSTSPSTSAFKMATEDPVTVPDTTATYEGPKSVFHDPQDFSIIHPLSKKWTLWFTKPPTPGMKEDWNDLLKNVISFSCVEEFWGIYNNIQKVSELPVKSDYHLFREGVKPEWEDEQNKRGGKWAFQFRDRQNVNIDEVWLYSLLATIGETIETPDSSLDTVMGVVVNVRKGFYRIGLWTRHSDPGETEIMSIG